MRFYNLQNKMIKFLLKKKKDKGTGMVIEDIARKNVIHVEWYVVRLEI